MKLLGLGNILLKVRRKELTRTYVTGWATIIVAIIATSLGIVGNVALDPRTSSTSYSTSCPPP